MTVRLAQIVVAIAPFRAVRFKDQDLARVSSPPYDIISEPERQEFARDPHNAVHVILPRGEDRYAQAAKTLQSWLQDGTLTRDERPCFYLYEVHYDYHGPQRMRGFFAKVKLDPEYNNIRRHESTLKKPGQDRLDLLMATQWDTEPIQLLYRDERGWIDEVLWSSSFDEVARFTDETGAEHRVWKVDRPEAVGEVVAQFEDKSLVIADGHHRYATAIRHAENGREEDQCLLACLVRDNDPGLHIHATHRLLRNIRGDVLATPGWRAERVALDWQPTAQNTVKLLLQEEETVAYSLTHDEPGEGLRDLAVWRVHHALLPHWGVEDVEEHVSYTRDDDAPLTLVRAKEVQMALVLPATPPESVMSVVNAGELMPQKSTFFLPKLRSGLVMAPRDEPAPQDWQTIAGDGGKADFRMPEL